MRVCVLRVSELWGRLRSLDCLCLFGKLSGICEALIGHLWSTMGTYGILFEHIWSFYRASMQLLLELIWSFYRAPMELLLELIWSIYWAPMELLLELIWSFYRASMELLLELIWSFYRAPIGHR
ncbi:hypothetical protein BSK47_16465 [Paenibacillus odorifer]|uniref:Uncharacterized protein n=1 Tax=Paenibacillus odorifer TaxID=189426 RepID=A0AB36JF30_9BACL|nr:hypothetical protein BSK47_16465 [Paenibacillus odorifer]